MPKLGLVRFPTIYMERKRAELHEEHVSPADLEKAKAEFDELDTLCHD